jgi:hypothetical protein
VIAEAVGATETVGVPLEIVLPEEEVVTLAFEAPALERTAAVALL